MKHDNWYSGFGSAPLFLTIEGCMIVYFRAFVMREWHVQQIEDQSNEGADEDPAYSV